MCVCACVRARARVCACVPACMCVCVRALLCMHIRFAIVLLCCSPHPSPCCRKTHLAFITKLNVCLGLRCDCLRDGDTDGVTVDNMQTLRKPLEKCLLGACPVFPFDLADQQHVVAAAAASTVEPAAAARGAVEGGTLVRAFTIACPMSRAHAALTAAASRSIR